MFKFLKWALAAVLIQTSAAWAVEPGQALPALNLTEVQATKGQYIYIDYWASWCGPCRQSFPWMNALRDQALQLGISVRDTSNAKLFGLLHMVSSVVFIIQSILGIGLVWWSTKNVD